MTIDDIDAVFGFANGMKAVDDVEIKGLTAVFGDKLAEKPVVELKEVLGESRAAAATTAATKTESVLTTDTQRRTEQRKQNAQEPRTTPRLWPTHHRQALVNAYPTIEYTLCPH